MFIQSNIEAMQSYQSLTRIDSRFNKSLAKISSGMALPKPSFGGGKFGVANDMEALYQEYTTGAANVQDAIGFMETAQTAMMEVNDILLEMNDLAMRAGTDLVNVDQRKSMHEDFSQLRADISTILDETRFNNLSLFSSQNAGLEFSIFFGETQAFVISTYDMNTSNDFTITTAASISTQPGAVAVLNMMSTAINYSSEILAKMGSQITTVEHKVNILNEQAIQQKAMESRINELDFAKEMKNFTSLQVVLQASNAMISQANMKAQSVLQLFG